jgi:hypothetical protein
MYLSHIDRPALLLVFHVAKFLIPPNFSEQFHIYRLSTLSVVEVVINHLVVHNRLVLYWELDEIPSVVQAIRLSIHQR